VFALPPRVGTARPSHSATRRGAILGLIDMLRNEKPVRVTVNDQPPGFVFVHTSPEIVGEGET
jgi:hypothetical protein